VKAALVAIVVLLLALPFGTMRAEAETFDCQRPSMPLARLICGDAVLRAADAEENEFYDTALTASLDKTALREEERAWFAAQILPYNWFAQQHAPIDNAEIVKTYRQRDGALRQKTQSWRKVRHSVPGTSLATTCIALPQQSDNCTVAASAPIEGTSSLRYQRLTYAQPATASAIVIFAAEPDRRDDWLPLAVKSSKRASLSAPQAIASPAGTLILIAGNADSDGSALYRLDQNALQDIDDRSWLETLQSHLPDGLELSPEIDADYGKMQAVATVTRSQSTCCTVGSSATIGFAIEGDRIVVDGVTFGEPQGSPNDHPN
jgi:hypothetical protein